MSNEELEFDKAVEFTEKEIHHQLFNWDLNYMVGPYVIAQALSNVLEEYEKIADELTEQVEWDELGHDYEVEK